MAYTNAGFVTTATEVSGYISHIYIENNHIVEKGQKIIQIDPTPYILDRDINKEKLEEAKLDLSVAEQMKRETIDAKTSYKSQADLAIKTLDRYKALLPQGFVSKESVDQLINSQNIANENVSKANEEIIRASLTISKQEALIKMLEASLALAEYKLSKTTITAATTGYINNFSLSVGSYLPIGAIVCGVVDHKEWRIIAEYEQSDLAHIEVGQKVFFYLPNFPWKIWNGRVIGIGHAIARTQIPENLAIPYIEPVTDWIRYPYRFKVYIGIEDELPPPDKLFMGMNAYTLVMP